MTDTREALMDVAQELLQTRGYNGFSFRDVAERVGIKTASIHYHFPAKTDLCRALIERQRRDVSEAIGRIDAEEQAALRKLARYTEVFRRTLEAGSRMCLCGMLAAEVNTLDPSLLADLRASFEDHESWLKQTLLRGRKAGELQFSGSPADEARLLLSSLEGAMLVARTFDDLRRFDATVRGLLARLKADVRT
ncbi:MAG: TetR/AcrR family transcriptional regulator [Isosphaeraceae bacterium]